VTLTQKHQAIIPLHSQIVYDIDIKISTNKASNQNPYLMNKTITAAMLVIGNEVLSGRTQDANIKHVGTELGLKGIQLSEVRIVADVESAIVEAVNALRSRYDYVFTTGGIGPTHDDITSECVAKAFGVKNVPHPEGFPLLEAFYAEKGIEFNEARQRMGHTPEGADLIKNHVSMAPGYRIGNVHVMAGVPRIMRDMLEGILPSLKGGAVVQSRAITTDLPEGVIAEHLKKLQRSYDEAIDIGSYPKDRQGKKGYIVSLIIRSSDEKALGNAVNELKNILQELGGNFIDGEATEDELLTGKTIP